MKPNVSKTYFVTVWHDFWFEIEIRTIIKIFW